MADAPNADEILKYSERVLNEYMNTDNPSTDQ